uniref:Integrin subunit alpha 6 n=1 Tax=Amphilophus citrinellus TaxID=61819 RepID=A0A3Q0QV27_AMPCI
MARAALIFSVYILESTLVLAFNLDTKQVLRKDGEPGSLFGFSLAMHRQLNPDKVMVLVGAPRARALSNQAAKITGGLYKCEVTQSNDCERIEFDNEVNPSSENKENQWMGVTVQSQGPGGKIVTCAHRYQKRWNVNTPQESHYIPGRCYILSQDLTINPGSEDGGNWKFCDGRNEDHEGFGTCQQGVAATFTKDYHYMVFGAPGAYNWKGVVRVEQDNSTLLDMGIFDDGPFEVGDERTRNPNLVPVPANSYLGFSLDSGHYITSVNLTVVAGAPRTNHSGAVVLFKKDTVAHNRLSMEHILHGPGLGSSFGYDVAVVDLNSDGWQDIVVGAPQFYMKDGDIGGAVYVYINKAGVWEGITPVRLNGTKDSMFGVAVENIGDINQDSYKDIAIGAPHADSGIGKVYIYHGSAQGIRTTQVLSGKDHNIRLFGYSLAGNMDLDGNSYPDLAVGSLSDSALIYRARPVISLSRVVKVSPNEIRLTNKTCGDGVCFAVTACFSYKANPASYNPKLSIAHGRGLTSRVMFLNESSSESEYQFNGTLNLKEQNQQKCITLTARLKDNIKDKMHSIPIEVSAEISPKQGKAKNGLPPLMPILDATQPSKGIAEVNFLKEGCGRDHICRSNLKMEYSLYYRQPNQDVYLPLNKRLKIILRLATNLTLDTTEIEIDLQLMPPTCLLVVVREANPSQVFFGGVVRGESAMKSEEEIGSLINFTFTIDNSWKPLKPPFGASLHIHWPKVKKNGKWLLYLVSITSQGPEKIHCSPESEINPLSITQSSVSRTKREILRKERATGGKNSLSDRSILVNGMKGCVVLKCPLQGLDGTVVTLRSRLWNSTFIELNSCTTSLTLYCLDPNFDVLLQARVQVFPDSEVAKNQGVPWWIILVAVLIGALILALLVYLLWKCGFFKRSKEDDSIPRYHAVRIRKETPEYKDGKMIYDPFEKKQWMTTWMDDESYS